MDGDVAPIAELQQACVGRDAMIVVDDAHGLGVLGDGRGVFRYAGLDTDQVMVGTLGKAVGVYGAFVASSRMVVEAVMQFARTYTYTTALPPAVATTICVALERVRDDHWRRERLRDNISRFRIAAAAAGLRTGSSDTPIQPLLTGDAGRAMALSAALRERGYLVTAIRPPTVPAGTSRLRIALSAGHSVEQVDGLVSTLAGLLDHA